MNDKNKAVRKDNVWKSFNGTAVPKTKVPDLLGIAYSNNQTPWEAQWKPPAPISLNKSQSEAILIETPQNWSSNTNLKDKHQTSTKTGLQQFHIS